jgi:hypothetical protein
MALNLRRLSLANARLRILTRTETDFKVQFRELMKLRERVRNLSADSQNETRDRSPTCQQKPATGDQGGLS